MKWEILHKTKGKKHISVHEIVQILLENRGIRGRKNAEEFLNPSLHRLNQDFFSKSHLSKAISRIKRALAESERVIIYSDYDVDGITATAILWESLRSLGVHTLPFVPHRMSEGYGLSIKGIDHILEKHPDTKVIITVDNGIAASEAVSYANEKGIDVILTDHHVKPDVLPDAYSIIHTSKLSGSGVALLFSALVYKNLQQSSSLTFDKEHLALAALGTVADLVPLVGPNRVIVTHGLYQINKTSRLGLRTLIEEVGIADRTIGTYEVGFILGPRINASGRLGHGLDALRLLCTKSQSRAWMLAAKLDALNTRRKELMKSAIAHAKEKIATEKKMLFVSDKSYHEGVIGLIAGGLVDEFYRPAIVVSEGTVLSKASARSVSKLNIIEAIRECSDLLISFGGHPMAAGFTIETEKLPLFEEKLYEIVLRDLTDDHLVKRLTVDAVLPLSRLDWEMYDAVSTFYPFGIGNKEPVFASQGISVVDASLVGKDRSHLKLTVKQKLSKETSRIFEAIGFGRGEIYGKLNPKQPIDMAYTLSLNEWNGKTSLQLVIRDIKI